MTEASAEGEFRSTIVCQVHPSETQHRSVDDLGKCARKYFTSHLRRGEPLAKFVADQSHDRFEQQMLENTMIQRVKSYLAMQGTKEKKGRGKCPNCCLSGEARPLYGRFRQINPNSSNSKQKKRKYAETAPRSRQRKTKNTLRAQNRSGCT